MKALIAILAIALIVGMSSMSEAKKTVEMDAQDIISNAQTLQSIEEKVEYLLIKGNEFLGIQQYQNAYDVAQYILSDLDPASEQAATLLTAAEANLSGSSDDVLESNT